MPTNQLDHPAPGQLSDFALGRLEANEVEAVESHLAGCPGCCDTLKQMHGDTFISLVRASGHPNTESKTDMPHHLAAEAETIAPRSETTAGEDGLPIELTDHARYRVLQLLGSGGMGSVYMAEHRLMQRSVALKVIHPKFVQSRQAVERFRREVRAAARLQHPNIVNSYDAEQAGDLHFLVMEYVSGTDLGRMLDERGPLAVAEACEYIRQAALGLQHAHENGMVHRDIKPQNLMLTGVKSQDSTGSPVVKILDFGLASLTTEPVVADTSGPTAVQGTGLTEAGSLMGTPDFMAPEQGRDARNADIRSDIYSLGCTLYSLLTGKVPFPGGTPIDKVIAHLERRPTPVTELRKGIPAGLVRVLDKMMAKDPTRRYQTPAEVATALAPFAQTASPARSRSRIGWSIGAAFATAAALLLAGIIYIKTDKGDLRIESKVDDVQVVVSKNGKEIEVIDLKSGTTVKRLPSGDYDIRPKGERDDVRLSKGGFTMSRGGNVVVTVTQQRLPERRTSQELFEALVPEMRLVVRAVREQLSEKEKQELLAEPHPLVHQLIDAPTKNLLKMFADLPAGALAHLKKDGYLKWKYSSLDAARQQVFKANIERIIAGANMQKIEVPSTMSLEALAKSDVGFAVINIPELNQAVISVYILLSEHPAPVWVTMVGVKATGKQPYFDAHNEQLPKLRIKPYSPALKDLEAEEAALRAAEKWLKLVDAGDYARAWEASSELCREGTAKNEFIREFGKVGEQIGKLKSRTVSKIERTKTVVGLPPGDYVVIEYRASYENLKDAVDTVIMVLEKGQWRAAYNTTFSARPAAGDQEAKIGAASKTADAYLKAVDAGEFDRVRELVAAWAKEHGPKKEEVVRTYESLTKQSGKPKARTPIKPQYLTALPGAPEGEYVLFGYTSRFEHWENAVEQLVLKLEPDGQWRAVGYYRNPAPASKDKGGEAGKK